MPTLAELEKEKKKAKSARAELRELESQLEVMEDELVGRDPVRTGLADLAGDGGVVVQAAVHDLEIWGPVKVGHVTAGLGVLARAIRLGAKPHSALDVATRFGDGLVKGAEAIETNRRVNARREAKRREAAPKGPRPVPDEGERAFERAKAPAPAEDAPDENDSIETTATQTERKATS